MIIRFSIFFVLFYLSNKQIYFCTSLYVSLRISFIINVFFIASFTFNHITHLNNNFMFQQLLTLFSQHRPSSQSQIGRILDILRTIPHFNSLNSQYGAQYLALLIPLLQPYLLRKGMGLLDNDCEVILLGGQLVEEEMKYEGVREVEINKLIDLGEKLGVRIMANSDCRLIKIKRYSPHSLVSARKLMQREREQPAAVAKIKKTIKNKGHQLHLQALGKLEFFRNLGEYDLLEVAALGYFKEYSQGGKTHSAGDQAEKIGCVLSGRVKITFGVGGRREKDGVNLHLGQGEWIGLQQLLWSLPMRSSGEISSANSLLFWLPQQIFKQKFNKKLYNQAISRLTSLIQTKKALFQRSLTCRITKDKQQRQQYDVEQMNNRLARKLAALTARPQIGRTAAKRFRSTQPKQIQLPQGLRHKTHVDTFSGILPKFTERINLFPEEYQKTAICNIQLQQLRRLARNVHPLIEPIQPILKPQPNPEQLYRTILNQITPTQPLQSHASRRKTKKIVLQETIPVMHTSIYNNFRVTRANSNLPPFRKSRTLDILQ